MEDEKRKAVRIKSTLFVQYCFDFNNQIQKWDITKVKDISETGICILTGQSFKTDSDIALRLKVPSQPFEPIQLQGRVVGSKGSTFGTIFVTRIEFKNVPEDIQLILHQYIRWIIKNEKVE
jgi:hypothetical protein